MSYPKLDEVLFQKLMSRFERKPSSFRVYLDIHNPNSIQLELEGGVRNAKNIYNLFMSEYTEDFLDEMVSQARNLTYHKNEYWIFLDNHERSGALNGLYEGAFSGETAVGVAIGTLILPGIGSAIGGALGGWLAGNRLQKEFEINYNGFRELGGQYIDICANFYDYKILPSFFEDANYFDNKGSKRMKKKWYQLW